MRRTKYKLRHIWKPETDALLLEAHDACAVQILRMRAEGDYEESWTPVVEWLAGRGMKVTRGACLRRYGRIMLARRKKLKEEGESARKRQIAEDVEKSKALATKEEMQKGDSDYMSDLRLEINYLRRMMERICSEFGVKEPKQ